MIKTDSTRPSWLPERAWPFQMSSVHTGRGAIAVSEAGHGPTLLFVHTGLWSFIWRDVMVDLRKDFRCVTLDAPSNGLSDAAPSDRPTLEESSRAVRGVIREFDLRDVILVLHDLGGPSALAAVADTPEIVRGIVGINTFAWKPDRASLRAMLSVLGSMPMRSMSAATGFLMKVIATESGVGRALKGADRDVFLRGMSRRGVMAFHDYLRSARDSENLYRRLNQALPSLSHVPLLTIFGERNDPFGFQRRWRELFPQAEQLVIPKGNHFPMCDDPAFVSASIRKWSQRLSKVAA